MAQRVIWSGKRNVPPFKGGTCNYLMLGNTGVYAARKASRNAESVVLRWRFCGILATEHVEASRRTLARESRHIVAFGLSDTTSRAAVLIPRVLMYRRKRSGVSLRPASLKGFRRHGFFEA